MNHRKFIWSYGVIIVTASTYYGIYLYRVWANVAWLSWFDQLPLINKWFSGSLRIRDLVTLYGEHGMFGYNILSIVNAAIFRFNSYFDAVLNLLEIVATLIFVAIAYLR